MSKIWVSGEVLIDLIPENPSSNTRIPVVGGGPANTARALARLGHAVEFIGGISRDSYGEMAREELTRDGVGLSLSLTSEEPTAQAIVTLDLDGSASYQFIVDKTATFDFDSSWLPRGNPSALYIGTLATVIEPGASALYAWASAISSTAPIIFDPNIRPSFLGDRQRYCASVERWARISQVVKVSDEDLAWLYPETSEEDAARHFLTMGVNLVLVTRGSDGLMALTHSEVITTPGVRVDVFDTVGAGDTVGAIVVEAVAAEGVVKLQGDLLKDLIKRAAKAASITVSRKGANPPFDYEL